VVSFDIFLLGLQDPSSAGRVRFLNAMERLSGRAADEHAASLSRTGEPLFRSLDRDQAQVVARVLEEAGVRIEIRPTRDRPVTDPDLEVRTAACPRCGFVESAGGQECRRCGLVFAKWEREKVQRMQTERRLEEALQKALQVRQEWVQRAKVFLETHPLPPDTLTPFSSILLKDEIPFLSLSADEGPLLLTSRRLLFARDGEVGSLPYEMIADVDVGGGLVVRKDRMRILLTFHGQLTVGESPAKSIAWQLDKDSSFYKDVLLDWCFARNFQCGSCGAGELDFRVERGKPRARCMRCATDHDIDLTEAVAIPLVAE
jgi:hypothetical protein